MINIRYKLINPKQIIEEFVDEKVLDGDVVVRPKYLSICKADQRYYQGTRDKQILNKKLPLSLIHEGIGEVIYSKCSSYKIGDNVVMLPNVLENKGAFKENYDTHSKFCGSSCDGFMRQNVICKDSNLLKLPSDDVSLVFLELMSVAFNAVCEFDKINKHRMESIAIYGDGSLSFITSLIMKKVYKHSKIIVIGKHKEKLSFFTFADEVYTLDKLPDELNFDHAFECVGGRGSESAINQIIEKINPQGIVSLLGVSENSIGINTRMVLEKGLYLIGNSRSSKEDFEKALKFIIDYPDSINYLKNIISDVVEVNSIKDMDLSFMLDTTNQFKTIMKWNV